MREAPPGGDEATPSAAEDPVSTTTPAKVKELALDLASGRLLENELSDPCDPDRGDEYCPLDGKTGERIRLTLEEKEKIYMDAVQSFYFSNRELLPQQEFDLLKEDLSWNGSPVISMNRREQAFLNAKRAYLAGEPSLSDEAFDGLKAELRAEKSKFAVSTEPRCYIDTGICTVTLQEDKLRDLILYLPAAAAATLVWTEVGYEFFNLFDVHFNPILQFVLGAPLIAYGAKLVTERYMFQNKKLAYGPCPACNAENRIYFGDIVFVEGFTDVGEVKCVNKSCKTNFNVQRDSLRASTVNPKGLKK